MGTTDLGDGGMVGKSVSGGMKRKSVLYFPHSKNTYFM